MKHRSDIDGLRAIAVLSVVLYHTKLIPVPAGFVGVDIFFVISGFLITGLLLKDLENGHFSIAGFYERRARRLLPALFAVLLCASIGAYALLLPADAADFGGNLVATLFFCSNIVFARQTGYFDAPAEIKPLLHTWSLAVEEQFYIVYPLFLFLVFRYFRKRYALMIGAVMLVSFAESVRSLHTQPMAAFYVAPARGWELLLGALFALPSVPALRRGLPANLLGALGLGLIGYAMFGLSADTPYPGVNALYPCIGAALLIYSGSAGESGPVGEPLTSRLLNVKPLVFLGLISYSLYLWHWVILVFTKQALARPLGKGEAAAVIAMSLLIATLSWRFIESPFRGRRGIGSRAWIFSAAAAGAFLFGAFGVLAYASNGLPWRFSGKVRLMVESANDLWPRRFECMDAICRVGAPDAQPTFLLWGDSHAGALAPAIEQVALRNHLAGYVAYYPACAPLVQLKRYDLPLANCAGFADSVIAFIKSHRIEHVFLHGRWGLYTEATRYKQELGHPAFLTKSLRQEDNPAAFEGLVRSTLQALRSTDSRIEIIASIPEVGINVPTALARADIAGVPPQVAPRRAEFTDRQARALEILRRAARDYSVPIVYPHEVLCSTGVCLVEKDQRSLYSDDNHLSVFGAMYLAPMLQTLLNADVPPN